MRKPGRQRDEVRDEIARRFKLNEMQRGKLSVSLITQIQNCKSDEARRLILGKSR